MRHDRWRLFWLALVVILAFLSGWLWQKNIVINTFAGAFSLEVFFAVAIVICVWYLLWGEYLTYIRVAKHMDQLNTEMVEREKAQTELQKAYEEIEDKIRQRTLDLTQAQEELQASNALMSAVFQTMRAGILVMPHGSRQAIVNKAFNAIWKLDPHDEYWECRKLFPRLYDRVTEIDPLVAQLEEIGIQAKEGKTTLMQLKDERLVETYFLPFYVGKELKGRIHLFRDVTDQEANHLRLQATVRELETFKRALDYHAQVSISDKNGVITYINERMCSLSGYTPQELIGQTHRILNSGYHSYAFFESMWVTLKSNKIWRGEIRNRNKEGHFYWVQSTLVPFFDGKGEPMHYLAINTDITERRESEEKLRQAKDAAESATRAKSEFLANISHEIRTPMNAILGFGEILASEIKDVRHQEYLRLIHTSGNTLLSLINDLLDLSKIEAGKFNLQYSRFDIRDLFQEVQNIFFMKTQDKNLHLLAESQNDLPRYLVGDEVRIRQILFNLVGNAVKFTEKGYVKIKIEARNLNPEKRRCDLILKVSDTGIGISSDNLEVIFEAFKQADGQSVKKFGGTGLGLTITRRLVEMMDGELRVESELNKGSTFSVLLKHIEISEDQGIPDQITSNEQTLSRVLFEPATLLIADDDILNRRLISACFKGSGLTLIEAETGADALEKIHQYKPNLVLIDMMIPEMNGITVTQRSKASAETQHIPIVLITAMGIGQLQRYHEDTDADGYLAKPIDRQQLIHLASRYLRVKRKTAEDYSLSLHTSKTTSFEQPHSISNKTRRHSVELLAALEGPFKEQWESLSKRMQSHTLLEFAEATDQLGAQYDYPPLTEFGNQLKKRVAIFDIGGIRTALQHYPKIIENLKNALEQETTESDN